MSAKKMLVVSLKKTKAVLGVATRSTAGAPAIDELVGEGLVVRQHDGEASLVVPADDLEVKEVDYSDDVFLDPGANVVDASGSVVVPPRVTSVAATNVSVTVTVPPGVAAGKAVLVVIDGGPNQPPLKFSAATALNATATVVPVSGVPPGAHLVLGSVDGYASLLFVGSFT
jgi:hypothetical protein